MRPRQVKVANFVTKYFAELCRDANSYFKDWRDFYLADSSTNKFATYVFVLLLMGV